MFARPVPDQLSFRPQILRVPVGRTIEPISLSPRVFSQMTHWTSQHTVICTEDDSCGYCAAGRPQRFSGFLLVQSLKQRGIFIFHFPATVAKVYEFIESTAEDLVGIQITAKRTGTKRNSPCVAHYKAMVVDTVARSDSELEECVRRVYATTTRLKVLTA